MRTLNDMPDYLKEEAGEDWSPARGLLRGIIWATVATLALGALFALAGSLARPVFLIVWTAVPIGLVIANISTAVTQRAAGMAGVACTAVAGASVGLVVLATQVAVMASYGDRAGAVGPGAFSGQAFLSLLPLWLSAGAGVLLFRNGDGVFQLLEDFGMINPLTGRK